jgi:hypothetical protein
LRHCGACAGRHVTPQGAAYPGALTLGVAGFLALFSKTLCCDIFMEIDPNFCWVAATHFSRNCFSSGKKAINCVHVARCQVMLLFDGLIFRFVNSIKNMPNYLVVANQE